MEPAARQHQPERIGPYLILDTLGEGGMGTVYLAEQRQPVRRRVALKVVKLGMDSKAVLARFDAERQALSMMEHSCIARVLDAGLSEQGQPYFAMEYVKGVSITRYCDEHKLGLDDRIRLFRQVCSGVQHAHLKGVMHRDLKPGNVLVTVQDGKPTPKIIDFGLAKAMDHRLVEATIFTQQGQMIGTPEYMSPEQAGLGGLDVDTRTDVYSLGVLLYELLVGELPFSRKALRDAGLLEMQRVIREQEPARPSTRITTLGEAASPYAASRRVEVGELQRKLRGDLDWIVLKALEKDRTRRYETAQELAADLERHLTFEPVLASPPSVGYRLRKILRRYRSQMLVVMVVLTVAVAGAVVAALYASAAIHQAAIASERTKEAVDARNEAQLARQVAERNSYSSSLFATQAMLAQGDNYMAARHLRRCDQAQRGIEWDMLNLALDSSIANIAIPGVDALQLTGDGETLVTLSNSAKETQLRLWRVQDGVALGETLATEPSRSFVAPGADLIVRFHGASHGKAHAAVVDRKSGRQVADLEGCVDPYDVSFNSDGTLMVVIATPPSGASGDVPTQVQIWDLRTGFLRSTLELPKMVWDCSVSSDGMRLVTASYVIVSNGVLSNFNNTKANVWDLTQKAFECSLDEGAVTRVAIDPQGANVATVVGRSVKVWHAENRTMRFTIDHDSDVESLLFDRAGRRLATATSNGDVHVWDATTGKRVGRLRGHSGSVRWLSFSADGNRIAAAGGNRVRVWDSQSTSWNTLLTSEGPGSGHVVQDAKFSQDRSLIASASGMGVAVWDASNGTIVAQVPLDAATAVAFDPRQRRLAGATQHGDIALIDWSSEQITKIVPGHIESPKERWVRSIVFSNDGSFVVTAGSDATIRVWSASDLRHMRTMTGHASEVTAVALTRDDQLLVSGSNDGSVRLWDLQAGTNTKTFAGHQTGRRSGVNTVSFSHDGRLIVSGGWDNTVRVWDIATGEHNILVGHKAGVEGVAFEDDSNRLASVDSQGELIIWQQGVTEPLFSIKVDGASGPLGMDTARHRILTTDRRGVRVWDSQLAHARRLWPLHNVEQKTR